MKTLSKLIPVLFLSTFSGGANMVAIRGGAARGIRVSGAPGRVARRAEIAVGRGGAMRLGDVISGQGAARGAAGRGGPMERGAANRGNAQVRGSASNRSGGGGGMGAALRGLVSRARGIAARLRKHRLIIHTRSSKMTKFLSTFSGGGATLRGSMRGQAANRPNSIRGRAARSALSRGLNRGGAMGTGSNVRGAALQARRQRDTGALIRGGAMRNAAIRAARGVAARLRLFTHAGSSPQGRLTPWSP